MRHRETEEADWKIIDAFFDMALADNKAGKLDDVAFKYRITHFIGLANNEGIDSVIKAMEVSTEEIKKNGWRP